MARASQGKILEMTLTLMTQNDLGDCESHGDLMPELDDLKVAEDRK